MMLGVLRSTCGPQTLSLHKDSPLLHIAKTLYHIKATPLEEDRCCDQKASTFLMIIQNQLKTIYIAADEGNIRRELHHLT